jgi:signal transduction histidine kinase
LHVEVGGNSGASGASVHQRQWWLITGTIVVFLWVAYFASISAIMDFGSRPVRGYLYLPRAIVTFAGIPLSFGIMALLQRLRDRRLAVRAEVAVAAAVIAPVFQSLLNTKVFNLFFPDSSPGFGWVEFASDYAWRFWIWFATSGTILAMSYAFDIREREERIRTLQALAHSAQLRALHSQINPHFLFNSLNSVSALILDRKVNEADEMVTKLARFLRLGLAADPTDKIALSSEIELQRTYLEIEQLRYEDLEIDFSVPAELDAAMVPALILQPIVENAVKYGVAGAPPPARIAVRAWNEDRRLMLEVTDSGKGHPAKAQGAGIGLANVLQRLKLIYGDDNAELTAGRIEDGSFQVRFKLPLELA